jgi:transposase
MSVYLVPASDARCATPGCWCRDRVARYPSDLTDAQWELLRPEAERVMAELRQATGRPMVHELRAVLDAVFYVVRNGIEWRALPVDFPPWEAVYAFFQRWSQRGMPQQLVARLRHRLRVRARRDAQPSAAVIDSQSVKAADTVGAGSRGFDSGKKINGRKRHLAVDVEGFLLAVVVTAANIGDRMGAKLLVIALLNICTRLRRRTPGPVDPLGRQCHIAGHQTHRTTHLPGRATPVGRRTQLRVATAIPTPGPRLRTTHRTPRSHGLLGHRPAHDPQTGTTPY